MIKKITYGAKDVALNFITRVYRETEAKTDGVQGSKTFLNEYV